MTLVRHHRSFKFLNVYLAIYKPKIWLKCRTLMVFYKPFLETILFLIFKLSQTLIKVAVILVKRLVVFRKYSFWVRIYLIKYLYKLLLLYS